MNKYYYKHLYNWERRKIESLIDNKPILKPISDVTGSGCRNWKKSKVNKYLELWR